jgi:hypothetical protein
MFGITEEGAGDDREAIGLRGRFKASALVCRDKRLATMRSAPAAYPFDPTFQPLLHEWFDDDNTFIAKQVLLPVLGQPKASKRDVDGYYDPASGMIKGAKVYRHGLRGPVANINDVDSRTDKESRASHKLRPFVQICKPGLVFFGTLGAENCDAKELAALLLLLDYGMINHGFKLGLGRSFGLGSVTSSVIRIWIRSASAPQWKTLTFLSGCTADDRLAMLDMPEVTECKKTLWKQYHAYQQYNKKSLDEHAQRLAFPDKWLQYWNNAWR